MPEDSDAGTGGLAHLARSPARSNRTVTPAIAAALLVLAASFALSVAFVLSNGGLDLPAAERPAGSGDLAAGGPGSSPSGVTDATVVPSGAPSLEPSPATAEPSSSATPAPASPTASSSPAASAEATPSPPSTPTVRPSSNRYDLLTPCPDAPDCWIYVVRQGDNLFSIARYFGVPLQAIEDRNPWTRTTSLVAGQQLRLPPPTR